MTAVPSTQQWQDAPSAPSSAVRPSAGVAGLHGTRPPAWRSLQHWLLRAKPCSVGNVSISCHPGRRKRSPRETVGTAGHHPLRHPSLLLAHRGCEGPQASPRGWPPPAITWTQTHMHTKKKPDTRRRKDDVLKIAQNPLHLQTSEMLKPHVRRQDHCPEAGNRDPQRPPGAGHPAPCCWAQQGGMQPPGSGVAVLGRHWAFRWTAQDVSFSPSPQGHDPLWHKQGGVGQGQQERGHPDSSGSEAQGGTPGQARGLSLAPGAPCTVLGEPRDGHRASLSLAGKIAQSRQPHLRASAERPPARPTV